MLLDAPSAEEVEDAIAALEGAGPGLVVLGAASAGGRLPLAAPGFPWAFLARDAGPDRIVAAVRAVAAGLVVLEPELASAPLGSRRPARSRRRRDRRPDGKRARGADAGRHRPDQQGDRPAPHISDHTVKFHVAAILAKLGAESRTEAVHLAARRGLLTL